MIDLDSFAAIHEKYPKNIVSVYQIFRDLFIKQELTDIAIVDGLDCGLGSYFIEGKSISNDGRKKIFVPVHLDSEIDLKWVQSMAQECQKLQKDIYICVYTQETIIYQIVTIDLP